ncbi:ribosomal L28e protein family-domain-containing protein [Chytridium lagenaria]|nr:ribosomal L28e protein family-domain-containing protein [Chytridium lagenaria]
MQVDEVIWKTINHQFCSYKVKTVQSTFCRNEYNVSGLCNRQSCPLANSRYATVKEVNGILYLYMKTIERAHTPSKLWERVKLSKNYATAIAQIDKELEHWPNFSIHKCKQRMTKITQYLIRSRRISLKTSAPKLEGIKHKLDKRESRRELKAEAAARLEFAIEKELLERLKKGVYGSDGIVNANLTAFENALDRIEEMEDGEMEEEEEEEDEEEVEYEDEEGMEEDDETFDREFVSDVSDDEEDEEAGIEDDVYDIPTLSKKRKTDDDQEGEAKRIAADKKKPAAKRRNPHVVIEYEQEHEQEQTLNRSLA